MIKGLVYLTHKERLSELGLFSPGKRSPGGLIYMYKYVMGGNEGEGARLFSVVPSDWTTGNGHKLKHMTPQVLTTDI